MPSEVEDESDLQMRIHGDADLPTVVYLPGMHGDWTLITGFRNALVGKVRFVEFTYPRTLTWSLDDYARAVSEKLKAHGIKSGWLLGESFGSQLVWPLAGGGLFEAEGIVLAGGFGRHPFNLAVRLSTLLCAGIPMVGIGMAMRFYGLVNRIRFRNEPESRAGIQEFVARRTKLDKCAATHRLRLIAANSPVELAIKVTAPVYHLSGFWDVIVSWFGARRWLRRHCPNYAGERLIFGADHTVLPSAPKQSAECILGWMKVK
ncbi:MAG: alpha/beta fold hydrolase [Verrucomicrobiia bacterium]|jgi:pimeloyl-ACP methyl ester carboxylesterase